MADGKICCCGSNRMWLLILVGLNILASIIQLAVVVFLIVNFEDIDWGNDVDKDDVNKVGRIVLYCLLAFVVVILIVNVLPIFAEMKKRPGLHRPFRNWQIFTFCVLIAGLIALFVQGAPVVTYIAVIIQILITAVTIVFVIRRIRELHIENNRNHQQQFAGQYPAGVY